MEALPPLCPPDPAARHDGKADAVLVAAGHEGLEDLLGREASVCRYHSDVWFGGSKILKILDACARAFTFPVLDNGYVYLAATRLSLFRADADWAFVFEVFGFSPRAGLPDTSICTFSNLLHHRDTPDRYVSRNAYEKYLTANPNNEFRTIFPLDEGDWLDPEDPEYLAAGAVDVGVRGVAVPLPAIDEYARHGIRLEEPPRVQVFELCRLLAETMRDRVLATDEERRVSVPPHLKQILQLEEWRHPDISDGDLPTESNTFRQLAEVLETGDVNRYRPTEPPNTHWSNWPEAGLL